MRSFTKAKSSWLWATTALGLATAVLGVEFASIRYGSLSMRTLELSLLAMGALLLALSAAGLLGSKRGHTSWFLAVALVLPYFILGTGVTATYLRARSASDELVSVFNDTFNTASAGTEEFDDEEFEIPKTEDNPNGTSNAEHGSADDFVDADEDGVDDRAFAGTYCLETLPYEGYTEECMRNGGFDSPIIGSGVVKGDEGYVDKNQDDVDDHFYDGEDCQDTMGQLAFYNCSQNGGTGGY